MRVTSPGGSVTPSQLDALLRRLGGSDSSQVRWHVSRTSDRQLQTVLVDSATERQTSRRLAEALVAELTG